VNQAILSRSSQERKIAELYQEIGQLTTPVTLA
jgi:hypothetical protein